MGSNPYGGDWPALRDRLWRESGGICHWCQIQTERDVPNGSPNQFVADHLIAVVDGGPSEIENLVASCFRCNATRGNRKAKDRAGIRKEEESLSRYYQQQEQEAEEAMQDSNVAFIKGDADPRALTSPTLHSPRLQTPSKPEVAGSLFSDFEAWTRKWMNYRGFEWQTSVMQRALEVDEDGNLLWPIVIVTVPRQCGKSYMLSALCAWRMHQAERFGEPQTVLQLAQNRGVSRAIWRRGAQMLEKKAPDPVMVRWSNGQESIEAPDGSEWRLTAAKVSAIPGLSVSMVFVDEAWSVAADVVEAAIIPTMAMRQQTQLWLVSTAGDSKSDLMAKYRQLAIDQFDSPEREILLMEWSAAPNADPHDPATWESAAPFWDRKREKVVQQAHSNMEATTFSMQFLNQWVKAQSAWLLEGAWRACEADGLQALANGDRVLACEVSVHGLPIGAVETTKQGKDLFVRAWTFDSYAAFYEWLPKYVAENPSVEIIHHEAFRFPEITNLTEFLVKSWYGVSGFGPTREAVLEGNLRFEPNAALTEQVLSAVPHHAAEGKSFLSQAKSPVPIFLARAMVWTVARLIDPERPMRAGAFAA